MRLRFEICNDYYDIKEQVEALGLEYDDFTMDGFLNSENAIKDLMLNGVAREGTLRKLKMTLWSQVNHHVNDYNKGIDDVSFDWKKYSDWLHDKA